jgi:tRNA (cmo5U34)-methyltransferase
VNPLEIESDGIVTEQATWKFDADVAKVFDEHVRKSVPFYDEVQRLTLSLSDWFLCDNAIVLDIGCATGTTIKSLHERHPGKAKYIGLDPADEMLSKAKANLANPRAPIDINWRCELIEDYSIAPQSLSMALALYTMQFVHPQRRSQVCRQIYNGLKNRGLFVMVEKVLDDDSFFADLHIQQHWELKVSQGFSPGEIYNKAAAIRGVLTPLTMSENIEMLKLAGFSRVSIAWKWCNFVMFAAIKS